MTFFGMLKSTCVAKTAAFFCFLLLTFGKMSTVTSWIRARLLEILSARLPELLSSGDCFLWDFSGASAFRSVFPQRFLSDCDAGEDERVVSRSFLPFPRKKRSCGKLQASPLEHLPFVFHRQQSSFFFHRFLSAPLLQCFCCCSCRGSIVVASKFRFRIL